MGTAIAGVPVNGPRATLLTAVLRWFMRMLGLTRSNSTHISTSYWKVVLRYTVLETETVSHQSQVCWTWTKLVGLEHGPGRLRHQRHCRPASEQISAVCTTNSGAARDTIQQVESSRMLQVQRDLEKITVLNSPMQGSDA